MRTSSLVPRLVRGQEPGNEASVQAEDFCQHIPKNECVNSTWRKAIYMVQRIPYVHNWSGKSAWICPICSMSLRDEIIFSYTNVQHGRWWIVLPVVSVFLWQISSQIQFSASSILTVTLSILLHNSSPLVSFPDSTLSQGKWSGEPSWISWASSCDSVAYNTKNFHPTQSKKVCIPK